MNGAATALGESHATVGRRVTRLEHQLGFALTRRGANRTSLTDAGLELFRMVSPMASAAAEIETVRRLHAPQPDAPIKVTATTSLSMFLSRSLPALRQATAPREVLLLPSRRQFDLARGEADIALRMSKSRLRRPDGMDAAPSDLLIRHVAPLALGVYGVKHHANLPMIMSPKLPQVSRQYDLCMRITAMRPAGPEIDEIHLRHLAVKSGVGIGILPCWMGGSDVELVRVYDGPEFTIAEDVFMVRHKRTRDNPGVERAAKALVALLKKSAGLLSGQNTT